jgi:hypothetical protein
MGLHQQADMRMHWKINIRAHPDVALHLVCNVISFIGLSLWQNGLCCIAYEDLEINFTCVATTDSLYLFYNL